MKGVNIVSATRLKSKEKKREKRKSYFGENENYVSTKAMASYKQ